MEKPHDARTYKLSDAGDRLYRKVTSALNALRRVRLHPSLVFRTDVEKPGEDGKTVLSFSSDFSVSLLSVLGALSLLAALAVSAGRARASHRSDILTIRALKKENRRLRRKK